MLVEKLNSYVSHVWEYNVVFARAGWQFASAYRGLTRSMNNNDAGYVNYETIIYSVGARWLLHRGSRFTSRQSILRLDIALQLHATFNDLDLTGHYRRCLASRTRGISCHSRLFFLKLQIPFNIRKREWKFNNWRLEVSNFLRSKYKDASFTFA